MAQIAKISFFKRYDRIPPKADKVNHRTALGGFFMTQRKHAADGRLDRAVLQNAANSMLI